MTVEKIRNLYELTKEHIEVGKRDDDNEILAMKRGDFRKATSVAVVTLIKMNPARQLISDELTETMAALMAILFEEDDELYDLLRDRLSNKHGMGKDDVIGILKDVLEVLEEDEDE